MEDHSGWLRAACYPAPGESETDAVRREIVAAREAVAILDSS